MQWLAVDPARTIHGHCDAPDVREARIHLARVLQRHPGSWVISRASYECGDPTPLAPEKCHSCGIRDHEAGEPYCGRCARAINQERNEALRRDPDVKARNAAQQRAWRERQVHAGQPQGEAVA